MSLRKAGALLMLSLVLSNAFSKPKRPTEINWQVPLWVPLVSTAITLRCAWNSFLKITNPDLFLQTHQQLYGRNSIRLPGKLSKIRSIVFTLFWARLAQATAYDCWEERLSTRPAKSKRIIISYNKKRDV